MPVLKGSLSLHHVSNISVAVNGNRWKASNTEEAKLPKRTYSFLSLWWGTFKNHNVAMVQGSVVDDWTPSVRVGRFQGFWTCSIVKNMSGS